MSWQPVDTRLRILPRSTNQGLAAGIQQGAAGLAAGLAGRGERKREDRLIAEGRAFQTSERLASQDFQAGEADRARGHQERLQAAGFGHDERMQGRAQEHTSTENRLSREFQGLQASLSRTLQKYGIDLNAELAREGHNLQRTMHEERMGEDRRQFNFRYGMDAEGAPLEDESPHALDALFSDPAFLGRILGHSTEGGMFMPGAFFGQASAIEDVLGSPRGHRRFTPEGLYVPEPGSERRPFRLPTIFARPPAGRDRLAAPAGEATPSQQEAAGRPNVDPREAEALATITPQEAIEQISQMGGVRNPDDVDVLLAGAPQELIDAVKAELFPNRRRR